MKYLERYLNNFCDDRIKLETSVPADITVVIPAYKESFHGILLTLHSLEKAALNFSGNVLVLLLINYKSNDVSSLKEASYKLFDKLKQWHTSAFKFSISSIEMNNKKSGVGEARKCLMDAAFLNFHFNQHNGIIVNLDADTLVDANYFIELAKFFKENTRFEAASIAFAHDLKGPNSRAIIDYELHLRIFVNMQRLLLLPFAFQTVGSAMAVLSHSYVKEGGMVRKQAGEDFYFMHKYSKNLTLAEINSTIVIPSDRESDRVPFGTGKAINGILENPQQEYKTYNPESFKILDRALSSIHLNVYNNKSENIDNQLFENEKLIEFFKSISFEQNFNKIIRNVKDFQSYIKRFYVWFDAFMLMKYLHFMRDSGYKDVGLTEAGLLLLKEIKLPPSESKEKMLANLRDFDLESNYENQWSADLISKLSKMAAS